jgi:hypothetical protein
MTLLGFEINNNFVEIVHFEWPYILGILLHKFPKQSRKIKRIIIVYLC